MLNPYLLKIAQCRDRKNSFKNVFTTDHTDHTEKPEPSCPVAGTPGDHFPHTLIEFVAVFLDRKILAAHRAAYGDHPSAEVEHCFLAADPAFHEKPQNETFRQDNRIYRIGSNRDSPLSDFIL